MSNNNDLEQIRGAALDRIERSERGFRRAIYGAAAWESLFLIAFLLLADLHNRLHLLLLIATVGSYTMVVLGLVALGAHIDRSILRAVKAIEMLAKRLDDTPQ